MRTDRPKALAIADAATDGRIGDRITTLAADRRISYQSIADTLHDEFGITVSRDMVRRWVLADLAEAQS